MIPAESIPLEQLMGKKVAFRDDDEHQGCWHHQVGLKTGVVVKLGQSLAQKAELLGDAAEIPPELLAAEDEVSRVWVHADGCKLFPRGCETAVERECLLVLDRPNHSESVTPSP
jgi:hypothetical protein